LTRTRFCSTQDDGSEKLAPETLGKRKIPLCMNQYRMQFGVTRIPTAKCDVIRHEFPATAKHIVVMVEDQIYTVDVGGPNHERVAIKEIERYVD
jgi:carnitine O-acetyltransferase